MRPIVKGTTRPPYRYSSQRIGRPNTSSPRPSSSIASQCICFGNARSRSSPPSTSGSTSTVLLPRTWRRATRYSPLSVFTRSIASIATPCFLANPSAAGVGSPAALNAADTGGPVIVSSRSSWRSGMRPTRAVRRRGVLKLSTGTSGTRRSSFRRACIFSDSCRVSAGSHAAGSSSTPISSRSSRSIHQPRGFAPRTPLHALSRAASPARSDRVARSPQLARAARRRSDMRSLFAVVRGCSSTPAHFLAIATAICRTLRMYAIRSVTPMPPLASIRLNMCEHFRQ